MNWAHVQRIAWKDRRRMGSLLGCAGCLLAGGGSCIQRGGLRFNRVNFALASTLGRPYF